MLAVIALYSVINVVIQSIIQPKFQADALGLTTTLTFLSLVFWAWVLGPLGALLALPADPPRQGAPRRRGPPRSVVGPAPVGGGRHGRETERSPSVAPAKTSDAERRPGQHSAAGDTPAAHHPTNRGGSTVPKDVLIVSWKMLVLRGVVAVVFGIVAVAWPDTTLVVLVVLWGVWALVDGIGLAAQAFSHGASRNQRVLFGLMALVALAVALVAILRPSMAASAVTWVLGIWLLVRGLFELVGAFTTTTSTPRWLLLLGALLDLVLGALFVANPGESAVAVAVVLGFIALFWGCGLHRTRPAGRAGPPEVRCGPRCPHRPAG